MTLDAAEMLARAEAETALSDYGDPTLPSRFGVAVEHLNRAAWTRTVAGTPRTCATGC